MGRARAQSLTEGQTLTRCQQFLTRACVTHHLTGSSELGLRRTGEGPALLCGKASSCGPEHQRLSHRPVPDCLQEILIPEPSSPSSLSPGGESETRFTKCHDYHHNLRMSVAPLLEEQPTVPPRVSVTTSRLPYAVTIPLSVMTGGKPETMQTVTKTEAVRSQVQLFPGPCLPTRGRRASASIPWDGQICPPTTCSFLPAPHGLCPVFPFHKAGPILQKHQ